VCPSLKAHASRERFCFCSVFSRVRSPDLTFFAHFLISGGGTPLPTEGRLSGRIGHDDSDALRAAGCAAFFVRTLRQAPRLEPAKPRRRIPRSLASCQSRQSQ